ncbi:erythromycin esterase family protein [Pedobacter faecalis]|uniref:erythromycin esterase family protein n=1 Tax=Pedobacter faecalis TaxID=3041495 RepID=UPI00254D4ADC|nr:erythromycin esterase family protein [Pedobacter sp. ELA7]
MKNLCLSLICMLFTTVNSSFAQDGPAILTEIKNHVVPIDTGGFYKGHNEYKQSVFNKLRKFKVLGIGEQTHGTHEFFQTKKALIITLSREYGYNLVGLEAPFAEVENLNGYVLEGRGDLKEILKSFRQYTFECSEFESLVESLKDDNKHAVSKIKFFGFDFQSPFGSLEYLYKTDQLRKGLNAKKIQGLIKAYTKLNNELYSHSIDPSTFSELNAISKEVIDNMQANSNKDSQLNQYIESYNQFLKLNNLVLTNDSLSMSKLSLLRDSLMALNIVNNVTGENNIILWAHNAHLQKTPSIYSKSVGYFLKKKLKESYAVVGQTTSTGYFTGFNPTAGKVTNRNIIVKPQNTDFEYYFSSTGIPIFFLESSKVKNNRSPAYSYRLLGYGVTDRQFAHGNLLADFDFIIHTETTTGNNSFYLK